MERRSEHHTSMEPRPIDRGNAIIADLENSILHTSMEPRPIDRGNLQSVLHREVSIRTSMEPRPIDRGNSRPTSSWGASSIDFNGATTY